MNELLCWYLQSIPALAERQVGLDVSYIGALSVAPLLEKGVSTENVRMFCIVQLKSAFFLTFCVF